MLLLHHPAGLHPGLIPRQAQPNELIFPAMVPHLTLDYDEG